MENEFQGVTYSKQYLSVHWKGKQGTAVRFETVKVPWSALAADEGFQEALGHAVAAHLRKVWGATTDDYPLF